MRLSSFPLISLRRRFLRRRPPFSRSDAKPNSNIQNRPSNCGRARRCPSTKSETKGGKYEINDVFSCPVLFPFVNQLASNEWNYTLINSSLEEAAKYFVISFHFRPVIKSFNKWKAKIGKTIVMSSKCIDSRICFRVWIVWWLGCWSFRLPRRFAKFQWGQCPTRGRFDLQKSTRFLWSSHRVLLCEKDFPLWRLRSLAYSTTAISFHPGKWDIKKREKKEKEVDTIKLFTTFLPLPNKKIRNWRMEQRIRGVSYPMKSSKKVLSEWIPFDFN